MKKNIFLYFLLILFATADAFAQPLFVKRINIPVEDGGQTYALPWTGGFNNPQFSGCDINNDGLEDLVVFDKTGDKVVTFLNHGTPDSVDYTYAPEFEPAFSRAFQWMLLYDFDCDNVCDMFTYNIGSIDYYRGRFNSENRIEFDSVTFLPFNSFSGLLNIFISSIDLPALVDVNNDGDMDVLTFEIFGGQVAYYENLSQELTGTCGDTVIFEERTTCWGNFFESSTTNEVVLYHCGLCIDTSIVETELIGKGASRQLAGSSRHPGSTLLAYDEDGDGDKELILGDISFNHLNRLVNCGTPDEACICDQDPRFPSYDVSYNCPIFPASFYVDVNNDGLKDLIAAPNAVRTSENYRCIWYYKNIGRADSVVFEFVTDTFFVNETIDLSEGAHPVFFDYNNDGLLDIVAGNYGYYVNGVIYRSGLALFENTGTAQFPSFKLVSRDWQNVSSLARRSIHPAFGDMDGDGDMDMIVGEFDGFLHYYENTAGAGNPANFALKNPQMFDIDIGQFSAPFIYDVNGDGLPDLIVGEKSGNLNYFENQGTPTAMQFTTQPTNSFFGRVDVRIPGFPNGYSTTVISPLDTTGKLYVICGSEEGTVKVYDFEPDSIYSGSFRKKYNAYSGIDEGERIALTIADVTSDGKFEMIIGNYRGGLALFSQSDSIIYPVTATTLQPDDFKVSIYPNPAHRQLAIELHGIRSQEPLVVELYDLMGRQLLRNLLPNSNRQIIELPEAPDGIYFISLTSGREKTVKKIFIRN